MSVKLVSYSKTIKGAAVLDCINYTFERGKIYGLQGKNGSGKTMLLRAITGLIFPTSGYAMIEKEIIGKDISFPRSIGVLIENPSFIGKYSGRKNLELLASIKKVAQVDDVISSIRKVGLDPNDRRPYRKYSLGMKQRLAIACAVMENPDIILLDEPINALDPTGVDCVEKILSERKEAGALIIVACHDNQELRSLADEILTLAEGKIINSEEIER